MHTIQTPNQNRLLAALPAEEYAYLDPHLEHIQMPRGNTLCELDARVGYVYFPTTAIVSLLHISETGASTEIAMVGNDGMVNISLLMGGETTTNVAVVQNGGHGYRLNGDVLKDAFSRPGSLQDLLLRYTQSLLTQIAQTVVCNRHHFVEQQLCRWLLLSLDRLPSNDLAITQERIANMLGVRREGITEAAGKLQKAGLITYRRGHITVLSRPGLEARACECYAAVKRAHGRLLPEAAIQSSAF